MSLDLIDNGYNAPGVDEIDCFFGSPSNVDTHTSASTSELTTLELLQAFSAQHVKNGADFPSFATFLAAIKSGGLTDLLTTGEPYLVLAPTDKAFSALPKDQLDTLLADSKALGDLVRAHIGVGYNPTGTLTHGGEDFDRTFTNLLGEQLVLSGKTCCWKSFAVNGTNMGLIEATMVANGTRVLFIGGLIKPVAK